MLCTKIVHTYGQRDECVCLTERKKTHTHTDRKRSSFRRVCECVHVRACVHACVCASTQQVEVCLNGTCLRNARGRGSAIIINTSGHDDGLLGFYFSVKLWRNRSKHATLYSQNQLYYTTTSPQVVAFFVVFVVLFSDFMRATHLVHSHKAAFPANNARCGSADRAGMRVAIRCSRTVSRLGSRIGACVRVSGQRG